MPFSIRGRETSSPTCGTPGGAFLNSAAREQGRAGLRAHGTQDMSWSEVHLKRSSLRVSELLFHEGVSVGVVRRTIQIWLQMSRHRRSDLAEPCEVVTADVEAAFGGWPAVQHFAPRGGPGSPVRSRGTWSRAQQDPPRTRLRALTAAWDRALACEGRILSTRVSCMR